MQLTAPRSFVHCNGAQWSAQGLPFNAWRTKAVQRLSSLQCRPSLSFTAMAHKGGPGAFLLRCSSGTFVHCNGASAPGHAGASRKRTSPQLPSLSLACSGLVRARRTVNPQVRLGLAAPRRHHVGAGSQARGPASLRPEDRVEPRTTIKEFERRSRVARVSSRSRETGSRPGWRRPAPRTR